MERNAVRSKQMENGQVKTGDIAASTRARLAGLLGPEGPRGEHERGRSVGCEAGISGGGSASNLAPLDSVRTDIKGEVKVAALALQFTDSAAALRTYAVRCRRPEAGSDTVAADFVKLTAIEVTDVATD